MMVEMCPQIEVVVPRPKTASWPDRVGVWASGLCVVHCIVTPVLISMSAVLAHVLPSDEHVHRPLALILALIGAIALVRGYRAHKQRSVIYLMGSGLALIFAGAFVGDHLGGHWAELGITLLGSALMITSHRMNHTFCRDCACAE